jgi:hypothetical protein
MLYNHPLAQITLLLTIHLSLLSLTVINHKLYTRKTILTIDILERLLRVFMHLFLLLELEVGAMEVLEGLLVGVLEGLLVVSVFGLLLENVMDEERLGDEGIAIREEEGKRKENRIRGRVQMRRVMMGEEESQNAIKTISIKKKP